MKKRKILIAILAILIILLIAIILIRPNFKNKNDKNENTSRNFILNENVAYKVNTNGENTLIYIGVNENGKENYLGVSLKIDKNSSKEDQVKELISGISKHTGYKININSIVIEDNKIKIDFNKNAAPFENEESFEETDDIRYTITSKSLVPKTIFDSINKTLKSYFGKDTEVYFSVDSENINIEDERFPVNIDKLTPYK